MSSANSLWGAPRIRGELLKLGIEISQATVADLTRNLSTLLDSLAERAEFELPVPICEQSDDGIRLRFATSRRTAKRYRPAAHF
jgi:hypothetical protein